MHDLDELSSDLVTYAARLVRAVRRANDLPAGTRVLALLDEYDALSITALADADRCSQPTMSVQVAALAERGLVARRPNPTDARSSVITLTAAGRAELSRVRRLNADAVAQRITAHPEHSVEDLATAVAVLRDLLDPQLTASVKGHL
jgi:DNA-binding MarR family transcriptional regulator